MLGVRLDKEMEERLAALAARTRRSKSFLAKDALARYLDEEELKEREKALALARWEHYKSTGEQVSNEDVMDWMESWGTDQEVPCPVK
ncbi:MAG: CopG family transcriptional regulator [Lysobacteraceae bacterium]|nr:MAG: CopG family transcriptional regulator [Xanthomonadaceae bacterium]